MVMLFTILFIVVNVQDQSCQIQQKTADLQQVTQGDILIHHTDHLPFIQDELWELESTAYRFRYALKIQYTTLCKKCQTAASLSDRSGGWCGFFAAVQSSHCTSILL